MANAYKLILMFLFVFFLLSNAKARKSASEIGVFGGDGVPAETHYSFVLQGK